MRAFPLFVPSSRVGNSGIVRIADHLCGFRGMRGHLANTLPDDTEVVMPRWPIRIKLIAGLSVVVGMMLILMGGSIFGLHSFHISYLTLADQLPRWVHRWT